MKCYLAGPMRGYELYNFPTFESAARWLRDQGHEVVSPAEIDVEEGFVEVERNAHGQLTSVELTDNFTIEKALMRDYREILDVDAVVMLPGWEASSGVAGERRVATEIGVPCFEFDYSNGPVYLKDVPRTELRPVKGIIDPKQASGEVRVVDPETGGAKGQKLARFDLLPWDAIWKVAEQFGLGAAKYADRNWEQGYAWGLSSGALGRHFAQWSQGIDVDDEAEGGTGGLHIAAVAWHALVLTAFALRGAGRDDRSSTLQANGTER